MGNVNAVAVATPVSYTHLVDDDLVLVGVGADLAGAVDGVCLDVVGQGGVLPVFEGEGAVAGGPLPHLLGVAVYIGVDGVAAGVGGCLLYTSRCV